MLFEKINHIAIIVSNFEASRDFYVEKLGFKVTEQEDRPKRKSSILYLEAGDSMIELFSFENPPKRLSYPEACGLRHLAFSVSNFDEVVSELGQKGIEIESIRKDERTGKKMTFFKDPDDLPIEICET